MAEDAPVAATVAGESDESLLREAQSKARTHFEQGRFDESIQWAKQALALSVRIHGNEHLVTASAMNTLGKALKKRGDFRGAEAMFRDSLAIRERLLGPVHRDVAISLNNLAVTYQELGDYTRAESLHLRSLAIAEAAVPPHTDLVAASLNNLGNLYGDLGDYVQAERMLTRSVALFESAQATGPTSAAKEAKESPSADLAMALGNLAVLYGDMGHFERAEQLHVRGAATMESALGPAHPRLGNLLNNHANLFMRQGRYDKALPLLERSLAIWEGSMGPHHPFVAAAMANLALAHQGLGQLQHAEPLYRRSMEIVEHTLGPAHPGMAIVLEGMAGLRREEGQAAVAEELHERSRAIAEAALGPMHPMVAKSLSGAARAAWSQRDTERAAKYLERAAPIEENNLTHLLVSGSEEQKRAYVETLRSSTDLAISLHLDSGSRDRVTARLAATAVLRRKGRVLDAVIEATGALRQRLDAADQSLLDQLGAIRAERARMALRLQGRMQIEDESSVLELAQLRAQGVQLEERQQALEAGISERSSEFRSRLKPAGIERVQSALPPDAALVEWVVYRPVDPHAKPLATTGAPARYAAFVLRSQSDPVWVDLGEAEEVDRAVNRLRRALSDPRRSDFASLARSLEALVFAPLRPHLQSTTLQPTKQLLLSPDGLLNLVPFAALQDARHEYLIERFRLSYLGSGRDLLRAQPDSMSGGFGLVLAAPDFDADLSPALDARGDGSKAPQTRGETLGTHRSAAARGERRPPTFEPLPETAREAREIEGIVPGMREATGWRASKRALQQEHRPPFLHIATHGFFRDSGSDEESVRLQDSLLRSGLALAGANGARRGARDEGIMTALEVAGLDLWGTQLVVLSACDTGVGDVRSGEGVYGLRRALVMAGSQTQVVSLWKIDDEATRALMVAYYRGLMRAQGRAEALRQVQLRFIKRQAPFNHPYYWAGFIASGAWSPLSLPSH